MADDQGSDALELERLRGENARLVRALADANEQLDVALANGLVGYIVTRLDTGRIAHVNDEYCRMLGFSREQILASDPYQFWVDTTEPHDLETERVALQSLVDGETDSHSFEKRYFRSGQGMRYAKMWTTGVRDERGRLKLIVISMLDIDEHRAALEAREKLESKLQQAQKLESVGRLVGGVAHDFNNRLLVIMGYADLLKRGIDDPGLASHVEVVVESARRAADLTRQLLAYSRRQVLRPRASDLNAVVDGTRRMVERLIGERIDLVTDLRAQHPMLADPGQVEQVLMNLMLNARDAMPEGGCVTLTTFDVAVSRLHRVDGLGDGAYVAFAVTDTGVGIPASAREQIFEPFFTTKDSGKGTGLGLATVDGIVRQSGGVIELKSVEGRGSTFTVYLPRAVEVAVAPVSETRQSEPPSRVGVIETVLVVDDEEDVRRLLVDVLRIGGYCVIEARSGEEALALLAQRGGGHATNGAGGGGNGVGAVTNGAGGVGTLPNGAGAALNGGGTIDLLVTDLVMPGMTGTELADRLRARHPKMKVLFISGYAERDRVRRLDEREQFIPKPFFPSELFRRVNALLRVNGVADGATGVGWTA